MCLNEHIFSLADDAGCLGLAKITVDSLTVRIPVLPVPDAPALQLSVLTHLAPAIASVTHWDVLDLRPSTRCQHEEQQCTVQILFKSLHPATYAW